MKSRSMFRGAVIDTRTAKPGISPATSIAARAAARVRVGREIAGRGGKGVTVITGLPLNATEVEQLATTLKKTCGAGGAVRNGNIEIQGDHRDRLVIELTKLGYSARRSGG
ncbi:MAG: stress response translation initiation inhibitor YciH [Steroidobacteraceae bacterium]